MRFKPEAISHLRAKLGVTQTVFGQRVSVSQGTVSAWERGKRAPTDEEQDRLTGLWQARIGDPNLAALIQPKVVAAIGPPTTTQAGRRDHRSSASKMSPSVDSDLDEPKPSGRGKATKPVRAPSVDLDQLIEGSTRDGRRAFRQAADDEGGRRGIEALDDRYVDDDL